MLSRPVEPISGEYSGMVDSAEYGVVGTLGQHSFCYVI